MMMMARMTPSTMAAMEPVSRLPEAGAGLATTVTVAGAWRATARFGTCRLLRVAGWIGMNGAMVIEANARDEGNCGAVGAVQSDFCQEMSNYRKKEMTIAGACSLDE